MNLRKWLGRLALGAGALISLAVIVIAIVTRRPPPAAAAPIQARLELAAGEVTIQSGTTNVRALSGTPLLADVEVRAAKGARALIRLPDGASLFLRDETDVKLGLTAITLSRGEYWLDAPPNDREPVVHRAGEVSVSAADAGLSVRRDGESVTVYVSRGMAVVQGPGGRVEVKAGEQVTVAGAGAPQIAAVAFWDDWTGGMADFDSGQGLPGAGAGTIYGVDIGAESGSPARRLEIGKQSVRAVLRDGLSETEVDQTFFNPGERGVEGWYWFTVPARASVTGFAVETDGVLVDGEFQEQREAAANYAAAKSSGHAPAILEWVDAQTYRARIFPIEPGASRRVVLRYIELRPLVDGKLTYVYPMGARSPSRIGEFSLSVDLGAEGERMQLATLADARVEDGGRRVTMRRSGYTPRADFQLEASLRGEHAPFTVSRYAAGGESADYVMARYTPDVDWKGIAPQRGEVVVVVDTSAAGDDSARQLKTATAEAILRALSAEDRFALVSLDAKPTVLHPKEGLAPASDEEIGKALAELAEHSAGGATDLSAIFDVALKRLHGAEQPALIYVGDGLATSGAMTGEQLGERLRRALASSRARLFTVGVGLDADFALLGELSRAGGGEAFRVDRTEETTARALQLAASLKVPTITDLRIDLGAGLDEPFTTATGKVSRGDEVILLARTHHELPREVVVKGRIGAKDFEKRYPTRQGKGVLSAFVPRLWAAEYVRRLLGASEGPDSERGRIAALGLEYGLMTPYTSIIALESEAAYRSMGIERKPSKLRGVRLGALGADAERLLRERGATPLVAPVVGFGCSRARREPDRDEAATESVAPESEGGLGTRAKGEEGAQSNLAPKPQQQIALEVSPPPAPLAAEALAAPQDDRAPAAMGAPPPPAGIGLGAAKGAAAGQGRPARAAGRDEEAKETAKKVLERVEADEVAIGPVALGTCSDIAGRPLPQRVLIWKQRLKTARSAPELLERYEAARVACELPDWHAERSFLELMQQSITAEGDARAALAHFASRPEVQKHLAKLILRRAVDARLVAAVESQLFGRAVDWEALDRDLTAVADPEARLAQLREAIAKAPGDPNGGMRLVRLLVEGGKKDEALALGRRLRDEGTMTPSLAQQLGDVLARAGLPEEAVRTYSEIVEFDPHSIASRRLLGDIYLGHGWYAPAYLQYGTLTEMAPDDALGWLRLAAAAAGTGRVDEALRLERKVASAQGNPGPTDPRRWARLMSAARIARLLAKAPAPVPGQDPARRLASIQRELRELQLFSGPGTLILLTWEDLGSNLLLTTEVDGTEQSLGEVTDAAPIGLSALLASTPDAGRAAFFARVRNVPLERAVRLQRQDIAWDGKAFRVVVQDRLLEPRAASASL